MNDPREPAPLLLTRRHFLGLGGLGALGYTLQAQSATLPQSLHGIRYNDPLQPLVFKVRRAWDLLNLEVELINFMPVRQRGHTGTGGTAGVNSANPPVPTPGQKNVFEDRFAFHIASYSRPGYVVLKFGGQHIAEQAIWDRPVLPPAEKRGEPPFPRYFLSSGKDPLDNDIEFLRSGRFEGKTSTKPNPGMPDGLAGAWLAGHSQVVFEIPQRFTPLPFDLDELLERCLSIGKLRVHPRLLEKEPPPDFFIGSEPDSLRLDAPYVGQHDITAPYTRIEFPSMLYISPYDNANWKLRPTSWGNRAELWSLDLERPDLGAAAGRPRELRRKGHLFAFDTESTPGRWPNEEFPIPNDTRKYAGKETPKTSLYLATRRLLVGQMMEDNGDILARDFRLTTLGATADLHYRPMLMPRLKEETKPGKNGVADELPGTPKQVGRTKPPGFLTEWIQKTEIGRDYYVKEAFAGWWFPLQLPGESVTITERLFCSSLSPEDIKKEDPRLERVADMEGNLVAFLVARKFAVVKERERDFGPRESDDFDEVGAMVSRYCSIYRKVEILVDRTPVLSNQPTQAINGDFKETVRQRIKEGRDGMFVTGGSGADAGREVFWPRVAGPPEKEGDGRKISVYRFPVRLTFHDGTVKETDMPLLFCYDLKEGCPLYRDAPTELKAVALNTKVPLADPQPAGAINASEIGVEDREQMLEVLKAWGGMHPALETLAVPPKDSTGKASGPQEALFTESAARTISTLLGGARETLFDHTSSFRAELLGWLNRPAPKSTKQAVSSAREVRKNLTAFLTEVDRYTSLLVRDGVKEEMADTVIRMIAWGPEAQKGVDVSRAAQRFAAAVELIKSRGEGVDKLLTPFKAKLDTTRYKELAARADDFEIIRQALPKEGITTIEQLEKSLPALQVAWVATLGKTWQRMQWDTWFAELFITLEPNDHTQPWLIATASLIQKHHLRMLMEGKGGFTLTTPLGEMAPTQDTVLLFSRAFNPVPGIDPEKKHFYTVPISLEAPFREFFSDLRDRIANEGGTALVRLKAAIEEALPNETLLRQKAQHLAEDFKALYDQGPAGLNKIHADLDQILSDCSLHLRHLSSHADKGLSQVRAFMLASADSLERVAAPLRGIEDSIRETIRNNIPVPPAISDKGLLKLVLSSPTGESLSHFKNLLRETGGRLTAEIEDALLGLGDLVQNGVKQLDDLVALIRKYVPESGLQPNAIRGSAELAVVLTSIRKHREKREQMLLEISKVMDPWRGMLEKCLSHKESRDALAGLLNNPRIAEFLKASNQTDYLSSRLAARATDLLSRLRGDVDPGSMNTIQREIFAAELKIENQIVGKGFAVIGDVSHGMALLKRHGAPLDAKLNEEIRALSAAIGKEMKVVTAEFWKRCDALEQFMLELLTTERDLLVKAIRALLKTCGAANINGGLAKLEDELEDRWNRISPDIKALQIKFGQTLGEWASWDTMPDDAKTRIKTEIGKMASDLTTMLEQRAGFLEGAGLNLISKGRIALACPSMLKSFRDQSSKAVYHVEEMVLGMVEAQGGELLKDLRTAVGFPQISNMKVRVPDIDAPQLIKNTATYLGAGLRGGGKLEAKAKEAAGAFAEIVGAQASTIARDSGMADAVSNIQILSRDMGGMAEDLKKKVGALQSQADMMMNDLAAKADYYKTAGKEKLNEIRAEIDTRLNGAREELEAEAGKFLPAGMGKLFGVLPMKDILAVIGSPDKAPQMLASRFPDRVERNYVWENEIRQFSLPGGLLRFDPRSAAGAKPKLKVTSKVILWVPKPGQPVRPPDLSTKGQLGGFSLTLAGMLQLHFKSVCFTARNGNCDFDVKLGKSGGGAPSEGDALSEGGGKESEFMSFLGPLELIDTIRQTLSSFIDGSKGPLVSIENDRIYAGFSFMVPPIAFGAVAIENISLSVQLSLPLKSGALTFLFKLCERMEPFRVSVSGFTGGGYLGVQVSPDRKLCYVEGAAEFGGSLSFNVGVAKGEIFLMAGIYFKMEQAGVTFSGYVRAGGNVRVLGFIDVAVMFFLALYYQKNGEETLFRGECTLSVRVSMGFFKKTVRIQMERKFAGSKSSSKPQDPEQVAVLPSERDRAMASVTDRTLHYTEAAYEQASNSSGSERTMATEKRLATHPRLSSSASPEGCGFEHTFDNNTSWEQYWNCFDFVKS